MIIGRRMPFVNRKRPIFPRIFPGKEDPSEKYPAAQLFQVPGYGGRHGQPGIGEEVIRRIGDSLEPGAAVAGIEVRTGTGPVHIRRVVGQGIAVGHGDRPLDGPAVPIHPVAHMDGPGGKAVGFRFRFFCHFYPLTAFEK